MTEQPHNVNVMRDIEMEVSDINAKLRGKSKAEQERIIHEDRDTIMALVQVMLREGIPVNPVPSQSVNPVTSQPVIPVASLTVSRGVPSITFSGFIRTLISQIVILFGFDPMAWLYFQEYDHNAQLADKVSSDPNLWNALSKAYEVFEKNKGSSQPSRYLNKKSQTLKREVTSITDSNALVEAIISFCRVVGTRGEIVNLDCNDVKIVLADVIKAILNSVHTKHKINERHASPILKPGCYGYVEYIFASDYDIQESCCMTYKFVEVSITVVSFMFPNEHSFRAALRDMEV